MATVGRRRCTVTSFYRYAEEEGLIAHSPAVHVRRPRIDYESHAIGLDRNEVWALLLAAGLGPAAEHALVSLLALNGLRVSETIEADFEALGLERGHRTLTILRKDGKTVTIPMARVPPGPWIWPSENVTTVRSSSRQTVGDLIPGPAELFGGAPVVRKSPRQLARIRCTTHSSRQPLMLGCRCATCKKLPHMLIHGPQCVTTGPGCPWTAMPRTSCPPTSLALLADHPDILRASRYLLAPRATGLVTTLSRYSCVLTQHRATRPNVGRRRRRHGNGAERHVSRRRGNTSHRSHRSVRFPTAPRLTRRSGAVGTPWGPSYACWL